MMATALALTLGVSVGGAQNIEADNGVYSIQGCYVVASSVRCDLTFTPSENFKGTVWRRSFNAVTADGQSAEASAVSVGGNTFTENNGVMSTFYKGVTVKISVLYPVPTTTTMLRVIGVDGQGMNNIAVRGAAAPAPATAPAAINLAGNWSATLSNCKAAANNTVVCTATLKK